MSRLLDPAIALLNRLRYPQKFMLISGLFVLPLALALTLLIVQLNKDSAIARAEIHGSRVLVPLRDLLDATLRHRALAHDIHSSGVAREPELQQAQAAIERDLAELARLDQIYGSELQSSAPLAKVQAGWRSLRDSVAALGAAESDRQHDLQLAAIRELIAVIGDTSNLILDPTISSYYTMDLVLLKLPESQQQIAHAERLLSDALPRRALSASERIELSTLSGLLDSSAQATERSAAMVASSAPSSGALLEPQLREFQAASQAFTALVRDRVISKVALNLPASDIASAAGRASQANRALWDSANRELERLLQARLDQLNRTIYSSLAATLLALALVLYLLLGFYVSVMRTVRTLDATAQRMAAGEPVAAVQLANRDELGQVARSFNTIAQALIATSAQRQAVLDSAVDAIVTVDDDGRIDLLNPAAERIFGYAAAGLRGQPLARLIPAPHDQAYRQPGLGREVLGQRADTSSFPLELAVGEMQHEQRRHFILIARDLSERKRADAERAQLQERIIRAQAEALAELLTPLIPISDSVVAMPLIGALDEQRMRQVIAALLKGVEQARARVAIIDITGVPMVDATVAQGIIRAAQAVELLGARVVVTGIRPEVAQTLVSLGTDLRAITTRSTLQSGIAYAMSDRRSA